MQIIKKIFHVVGWIIFVLLILLQLPFLLIIVLLQTFGIRSLAQVEKRFRAFNEWYQRVLLGRFEKRKEAESKLKIVSRIDPRSEELKALPVELTGIKDIFNDEDCVLYYEPSYEPIINEYIQEHYARIHDALRTRGIYFFYPPLLGSTDGADLNSLMDYYFPDLRLDHATRMAMGNSLQSISFFSNLFGIQGIDRPCFIRNVYDYTERKVKYRVFYLPTTDKLQLDEAVNFYLSVVRSSASGLQFSLGNRDLFVDKSAVDQNDPDYIFECEIKELSHSLREQMMQELAANKSKGAMRMMLFLLRQMKEYNMPADQHIQQFLTSLQRKEPSRPSTIHITLSGKIILIDYNKEIKLEPVHRAVYIFFLLKPEGVLLKDMPKYKQELLNIYSKVSNRSSMDAMRKTVDDLANPFSNSMNEKCSRIREAFMKEMDERIARHYVIDGDRNHPKRISIDRSLVVFEGDVY